MKLSFQYFDVHKIKNDDREIKGIILENGIRIILISDKKIIKSSCAVNVGIGSLYDEHEGMAHFLEHLLFMGSEKYPDKNDYHSYIKNSGGYDNAFTSDEETCYYLTLESKFLKKGIEMLSWFFRAPLFEEKFIESERNIVHSEHEKNILSDLWIENDLKKFFFTKDNKYRKFSTGNNETLVNVKRDDIVNFYEKYYTTDNICICIVDSEDIDYMINNYVSFFAEIKKSNHKKNKLEDISFIEKDLIIYKSIPTHVFIDLKLCLELDRNNIEEYSLSSFIYFLLFTKFKKSILYYLLEDNSILSANGNIEYLYEKYTIFSYDIFISKIENLKEKIIEIILKIEEYLHLLSNLSVKEFCVLYETFLNITKLGSYFNKLTDSSELSIMVSTNMLLSKNKSELSNSLIKNEMVTEYSEELHKLYLKKIKNRKIKIITNKNLLSIKDKEFIISDWYNAEYYMTEIKKLSNNFVVKDDIKKLRQKFSFESLLNKNYKSADQILKMFEKEERTDDNKSPILIYKNEQEKKKIYFKVANNYNTPYSGISILRKNININDENNIIFMLYNNIVNNILVYYLEIEHDYLSNFSLDVDNEYVSYNFMGILEIDKFLENIMEMIDYEKIIKNKKIGKLFEKAKKNCIEIFENNRYDSPFVICKRYLPIHVTNGMNEEKIIEFLNKIDAENFVKMLKNVLEYENESIFIYLNPIINSKDQVKKIINSIPLNTSLIINKQKYPHFKFNYSDYIVNKNFYPPKEINNCLLDCYKIKELKLKYDDNSCVLEDIVYDFTRNILICEFLCDLILDKLFDKLRTVEKLGYIVKAFPVYISHYDNLSIQICYLIQSKFSVERLVDSINDFNKKILKKENFEENFQKLKNNKINLLKKKFENFGTEMTFNVSNIIQGTYCYDIKKITSDICKEINYTEIESYINTLTKLIRTKIIVDTNN